MSPSPVIPKLHIEKLGASPEFPKEGHGLHDGTDGQDVLQIKEGATMDARVEVVVVSRKYSGEELLLRHLEIETLIVDAVGCLYPDRVHVISGPLHSSRSIRSSGVEVVERGTKFVEGGREVVEG